MYGLGGSGQAVGHRSAVELFAGAYQQRDPVRACSHGSAGDAPINPLDLRQKEEYFFLGRVGVNTASRVRFK